MALQAKLRTDQMMVEARSETEGLSVVFADGLQGILPWFALKGLDPKQITGLEFANPWVLNLLLSDGGIDEIPSDFARYHLDPAFRASEQMADAESRRLFGKRLRLLREQQDVMLLALARTAGISPAVLIALEEGRESPTASTLQALTKGLRCSFEDLILSCEPK